MAGRGRSSYLFYVFSDLSGAEKSILWLSLLAASLAGAVFGLRIVLDAYMGSYVRNSSLAIVGLFGRVSFASLAEAIRSGVPGLLSRLFVRRIFYYGYLYGFLLSLSSVVVGRRLYIGRVHAVVRHSLGPTGLVWVSLLAVAPVAYTGVLAAMLPIISVLSQGAPLVGAGYWLVAVGFAVYFTFVPVLVMVLSGRSDVAIFGPLGLLYVVSSPLSRHGVWVLDAFLYAATLSVVAIVFVLLWRRAVRL